MATQKTSRRQIILGTIVLIVLLGLASVLLYFGARFLITVKAEVAAAIIVAAGTIIVSVISVLVAKHFEIKQEDRRAQREKKVEAYEKLISLIYDMVLTPSLAGKKPPPQDKLAIMLIDITKNLTFWGSDQVIKTFGDWKKLAQIQPREEVSLAPFLLLEQIFFEVRKDLGYQNKGLASGDLLRLFINDIDAHLP